jgi:hypothetical protein
MPAQPLPAPAASTTMTATIRSGSRTVQMMSPTATTTAAPAIPRADLRDLIALAKIKGHLDDLESSASARSSERPDSSRLVAVVLLARLARPDPDAALPAAEAWLALLKTRPELAVDSEALWVAHACLAHARTRPIGRQVAREVLLALQARGGPVNANARRELLLQLIQGSIEDGQKEEAVGHLKQLRELLGNDGASPRFQW